jgi:hypothetical protein
MAESYKVKQGECLASIAFTKGHKLETLWQDSANQHLRKARDEAHILLPDDVVSIPAIETKNVARPVDARHVFKRAGVPEILKLQMLDAGVPRPGLQYTITVDDLAPVQGVADGNGMIQHAIAPTAQAAKLTISEAEQYELELGYLDPANTEPGARKRLVNLGLLRDAEAPQSMYENALADFKDRYHLPAGNELLDAETQQQLKKVHGC